MNLWRLDMCQTGLAPCSHWEQRVTIITEFHHIHSPWPPVTECHFHSSWRLSQKWWGGDSNTALVGRRHGLLTIGAIQFQPLWWHWREDQRCRWRDVLHARGKRNRGVLKVSISQKKWVPIGSLSQSLGVPNSFGDSDTDKIEAFVILSALKFCDVAVSLWFRLCSVRYSAK